ncbi:ATP-binding protein [Ruegeria arenilitoris]|uniref:ATP-binding protein n=1 Tax=Ruegeria arenilitoris TaxID=1173585 RepID=UPI00147A4CE0|nr:ATP-binding protein [Ruegeria arenilitoris]
MSQSETSSESVAEEFDLLPDPRVLPMLGEINLEQWRCISELVDNSIDGFIHERRNGKAVQNPEVYVNLPNADVEGAMLEVRDNGPGMTAETLQRAVSAGWSGNNPVDNLGLFGMGFNIATARLGSVTEVWTTREGDKEWHGLEIDFERLRQQKHFKTPHLKRPKADLLQHGTEIRVKLLKPQQRSWLSKSSNQSKLRKRLSQTYSAMLRANGLPITFSLFVNNKRIKPRLHCVWSEDRVTSTPDLGDIPAVINFNFKLQTRKYCNNCMNWVHGELAADDPCTVCGLSGSVVNRDRSVRGWIGIQRYLDKTEFGFDLLRNGRKIEINSKDLFFWRSDDVEEPEYPIDDQRGRGRFVGEIHFDHCRVSYAKDRFDRTDPAWEEMVELIRGAGPLRPEKAKSLGFHSNSSPLFRLFRAFRRTSPQSKVAGAWKKIVVVKDNARATEMARSFHDGHPNFQDDKKWWELVEEAEHELLVGTQSANPAPPSPAELGLLEEMLEPEQTGQNGTSEQIDEPQDDLPLSFPRERIASLSKQYIENHSGTSWSIEAFSILDDDDVLEPEEPWGLELTEPATRKHSFFFRAEHEVFRSLTMTPKDALLLELAWKTADFLRGTRAEQPLSLLVAQLRKTYTEEEFLDPLVIQPEATDLIGILTRAFLAAVADEERSTLFSSLTDLDQNKTMREMARRNVSPGPAIQDGSFLEYAPVQVLGSLIDDFPEFFFDGKIWDEEYLGLDYGDPELTNEARAVVRNRYKNLVSDVGWLATKDVADLAHSSRDALMRAVVSMRMLRPDHEFD